MDVTFRHRYPAPAFKTDRDISLARTAGHRELQQWTPDGSTSSSLTGGGLGGGGGGLDDETFGTAHAPKKWDQFAANEKLFGAQSDYHDELYTTRLDRSGKDFKARESKAARIAEEIQSVSTYHENKHGRCFLFAFFRLMRFGDSVQRPERRVWGH